MSKIYLIILLFAGTAAAQTLPEATLTPTPLTETQRKSVREGSLLQTGGKFDEAIKKLTEAEKEGATNDVIPFELAKSHFAKKSYAKCIEKGMEAARYVSARLARIYTVIGNCHDGKGDPERALGIYNFALLKFPNDGTLHLNRAAALNSAGQTDAARGAAKQAARLEPNNANTQFLIASLFQQQGYRVPAILAAARYLALEPASGRTVYGLELLKRSFEMKVKSTSKIAEISLGDAVEKTDEGDFSSIEVVLAGNWVPDAKGEAKKKSDVERSIEQFELVLSLLPADKAPKGEGNFTDSFYVPYFKQMQEKKLVETLWHMIYAAGKRSESEAWLTANQQKVNDFMNWSSAYAWPKSN
jgi:tetratricopeptide (TPR) repeat protein